MQIDLRNIVGTSLGRSELSESESLADNLIRIWPESFPGFTPILQDADGTLIEPERAVKERPSGDYFLILVPQGPAFLGVPLGFWILTAVAIAATIILTPTVPSYSNQNYEFKDAESNFAANQENIIRPGGRVPEVFGRFRVFPDLIAQPYSRYFGKYQKLFELFVVSNGYVDIRQPRLHADLIDDNYEATIEVIKPGQKIPARFRVVTENQAVSSYELPAENESFSSAIGLDFDSSAGTISADQDIWAAALSTGLIFVTGTIDEDNSGIYEVTGSSGTGPYLIEVDPAPGTTRADDGGAVYYALEPTSYSAGNTGEYIYLKQFAGLPTPDWYDAVEHDDVILVDKAGVYTTHRVKRKFSTLNVIEEHAIDDQRYDEYWVQIEDNPGGSPITFWILSDSIATEPDDDAGGFRNWSPWFQTPNSNVLDIWFDFEFPRGLFYQEAGKIPTEREVQIAYQYREVGSATIVSGTKTYSERTRNQLRFSERIRDLTAGRYEMRFRRVTDFEAETASKIIIDEVTLARLAGAFQPADRKLKNCTAVFLEISTQLKNISGSRKFNCIASRYLPTYSGGVYGPNLIETNKIADAVAYTLIEQAGYSLSEIDIETLYEEFGGNGLDFRGVIDQEASADDQVALLLSVGLGYAYRRAGSLYFVRDKRQTIPRTLINRRVKVGVESKSMSFGQADEPDAVEVTFFDEDNDWIQTTLHYPDNITPIRPKKLTLQGKTQWSDAFRRAVYEWYLLKYRTDTLDVQMTEEGALLSPGELIAVTDHLRADRPIDGTVENYSGRTVTVDVDISGANVGDLVRLRNQDGVTVQESTVSEILGQYTFKAAANVTVEASDDEGATTGILFEIVPPDNGPKELWIVSNVKPESDGAVSIQAVNYADEIYNYFSVTVPDPPY